MARILPFIFVILFAFPIYIQHTEGQTYLILADSVIGNGDYTYHVIIDENLASAMGNDSQSIVSDALGLDQIFQLDEI